MLALLLCASGIISVGVAYPSGPPQAACPSMFPIGHDTSAQADPSPYAITLSQNTYSAGEEITVTVKPQYIEEDLDFIGLFVQARLVNCSLDPIGTFKLNFDETYLQLMQCNDKNDSAVSHKMKDEHVMVTFTWVAPAVSPGHIYFLATVVAEWTIFWIDTQSNYVNDTTSMEPFPESRCASVDPTVPVTMPPTMSPTMPPTMSPTMPPTMSPTMPPTMPPTTPPDGNNTSAGNIVCACLFHAVALFLLALNFTL